MIGKIKKIIKKNEYFYYKLSLILRIGFNQWLINMIFQRILRRHSNLDFNVNFTSTIIAELNIEYQNDINTMASFAASGHCYLQAINGIILGKNFLFAPGVKLISANHDLANHAGSLSAKPIIIGDNVWIGANAIILPEVEIGNNCIVGAGSVVTKSFIESNLIIAGNPARVIRRK